MTHEELIMKAKSTKSAQELLAFAKENGIEMTEESAKVYFEQLNKMGEISDDELDNVSGGGCTLVTGYTVVTSGLKCFITEPDGSSGFTSNVYYEYYDDGLYSADLVTPAKKTCYYRDSAVRRTWAAFDCGESQVCGNCQHLEFEAYFGYCGKSKK